MLSLEKKIIKWVESNLYPLTIIAITILSLIIRFSMRDIVSPDCGGFLLNWYDSIKESGGIKGLNSQIGNYNMLYQFVIALLTYLPIKPLYAYKLISCIFDYALAATVAYITYFLSTSNHKWNACATYAIVLLSPCVFLNSAAWAQCDVIYTFFIAASLLALFKNKYTLTFILYGIALAFKLQAIFIFPFFLFVYFYKKSFSVFYFFFIPFTMIITSIPCLVMGRSIKALYTIYRKQTVHYNCVHMNYPSFWAILNSSEYTADWPSFKCMSISITIAILTFIMIMVVVNKIAITNQNLMCLAFIITYTCVLFLPSMHERYGYCYEILAICVIFINKKTIPLLFSLLYMTFCTYGHYLYATPVNITSLAVINTITYLLYCYTLMKNITISKSAN